MNLRGKVLLGIGIVALTLVYFLGRQQGRIAAFREIELQQGLAVITPKVGDKVHHKLHKECRGVILWLNGSVASVRFARPTWLGLSSEDVVFTDSQLAEWECELPSE